MMGTKAKFKVGDSAFVVDSADYVVNNMLYRIPLGTEVKVRTVSVLNSRGYSPEVRYEVHFDGGPLICWVDEGVLSPRIFDVACAA